MAIVVTLVGILLLVAGLVIAVAPGHFIGWITSMSPVRRFWGAIIARAGLGIWFIYAAPSCRQPGVVHVFGVIMVIAAVALLIAGRARLEAFLAWWVGRPLSFIRGWSLFALVFGAVLIYSGA